MLWLRASPRGGVFRLGRACPLVAALGSAGAALRELGCFPRGRRLFVSSVWTTTFLHVISWAVFGISPVPRTATFWVITPLAEDDLGVRLCVERQVYASRLRCELAKTTFRSSMNELSLDCLGLSAVQVRRELA